jgi:SAM-dependent methyltransferase
MSDDLATRFPANPAQAEYWNTGRGEQWVTHQEALDARFAGVRDQLLARAAVRPGERALDIGCGTGATTLALAAQVGPGGAVLALDISAPMLELARRRCVAQGLAQVRFVDGDAQSHAFERAAYDLLVSRFGVMFFSDPVAAFANLGQALRPGGRLAFACWGPLADNPWFGLPLAAGAEALGEPDPEPPRAPGPLAFAETAYVEKILGDAGFAGIQIETLAELLPCAPTAEEEAAFARVVGPLARLVSSRSPDPPTLARITDALTERFRPYQSAAGLRVPATLHYVAARKP